MNLSDFSAKTTSCKVELLSGDKVELTFRPYILADLAWLQEEFNEKEALDIVAMKAAPICKIMWHQLTNESKAFFSNIAYEKFNEETEEIESVRLLGYEKILHSFKDQKNMFVAFAAYSRVENLNSFIPEKKKRTKKAA